MPWGRSWMSQAAWRPQRSVRMSRASMISLSGHDWAPKGLYCDGQALLAVGVGWRMGRETYVAHGKGSVAIAERLDAAAGNVVVLAPDDHGRGDHVAADSILFHGIAAETPVVGQRAEVARGKVARVGNKGAGEGAGDEAGKATMAAGRKCIVMGVMEVFVCL